MNLLALAVIISCLFCAQFFAHQRPIKIIFFSDNHFALFLAPRLRSAAGTEVQGLVIKVYDPILPHKSIERLLPFDCLKKILNRADLRASISIQRLARCRKKLLSRTFKTVLVFGTLTCLFRPIRLESDAGRVKNNPWG
jgi:hypothetical protein